MSTGQGFIGNNMFSYCLNNAVNLIDIGGEAAATAILGTGAATMLGTGATVGAANSWNPVGWVLLGTVAIGATVVVGYKVYERATRDKVLADVRLKKQSDKKKLYQLAYINKLGFLVKIGKK